MRARKGASFQNEWQKAGRMSVLSCIQQYNPGLLILAATVCLTGIFIAVGLIYRAIQRDGKQRSGWLFLAATTGGSSVWCTHFIAMMAYKAPASVTFAPVATAVSLIVVIAGLALGFRLVITLPRAPELGGVVIGLSIVAMHYLGVAAYRIDGLVLWQYDLIAMSVIVGILFSAASAGVLMRFPRTWVSQAVALGLLALGVLTLHFIGMTALTVTPLRGLAAPDMHSLQIMAFAVAGVAFIVIGTGVATQLIDTDTAREAIEKLKQLALNDGLTGLPNRAAFSDYLGHELHRAELDGFNVAVIGIDLDRFKQINDLRGHAAGDQALKIIGYRLGHLCRDGELVARIGGDEFSAIKRFTRQNELMEFLSRIETELFDPIKIKDFDAKIGASIGVAVYPQDGEETQQLINNADLAMYRAKKDVTRTVCFYEREMDEAARARSALGNDLRKAIEQNELELHYQVQHHVSSGKISGYEVLLRWRHPVRGLVPPMEFVPIAEETGLIVEIGEWVLRTACKEAASWPSDLRIAVNLSPVQFTRIGLERLVHQVLIETGLKASRLELEITESTIIEDRARASRAPADQGARRDDRDRRFRNGLFLARNAALLPVRQDQARPLVHDHCRDQPTVPRHHPRGAGARKKPEHLDSRGGRRNPRTAQPARHRGMRRSAGLLSRLSQADHGNRHHQPDASGHRRSGLRGQRPGRDRLERFRV